MARQRKRRPGPDPPAPESGVQDYRHAEKRLNNPPVGLVSYEVVRETKRQHYAYDPYLSPQLVWAGKPGLKSIEVEDQAGVEVEEVALHVHERVSTRAIIDAVRRPEPKQLGLFADPDLPLSEAVRFYQHEQDWANRLILGDSLLVMNSLLNRELMGGKVQMIYVDPPYGVKFSSNFQPRIDQREVKDGDEHLTREPETIKAYRDTWTLGLHSYLTYLRDRLRVCRELLTESGSIFVQIGDENVHLVRNLMDEIFGADNAISLISFRKKTMPLGSKYLESVNDFIIWYAKNRQSMKYHQIFARKSVEGDSHWNYVELPDGTRRKMSDAEVASHRLLPRGAHVYQLMALYPAGLNASGIFRVEFEGRSYTPPVGKSWFTNSEGMRRIIASGRVEPYEDGETLRYVLKLSDYDISPITSLWADTSAPSDMQYVVQTNNSVITRCVMMTTIPGDLVLDPTCGSGTTAHVAEQWGRRWITIDVSRVALALARQRVLTASFPYYRLANEDSGIRGGFRYKRASHIKREDYAQNTRIDPIAQRHAPEIEAAERAGDQARMVELKRRRRQEIDRVVAEDAEPETLYDQPEVERGVVRVSGPFTVEAIPPAALDLQETSPIGGAPGDGEDGETRRRGDAEMEPAGKSTHPVDDPAAHISRLIAELARDGVTFPDNRVLRFKSLNARVGGVLHAEGQAADEADLERVAISFGPQHGAVSQRQVEDALYEARRGGFDAVIFCGFAFQAEAQAFVAEQRDPRLKAFVAHIKPDVLLVDQRGESLLKTTASSQLFAVFGEPDVELQTNADGTFQAILHGVDVYDPLSGQVHSARAAQIAAWFVDTDYDRRTFCICQAFFPNRSAWEKLARALRGRLDEDKLEALSGTISLPFPAGQHRRVAAKVIDQRGNEVMRVLSLEASSYPAGEA